VTNPAPRIPPLDPPYDPEVEKLFRLVMPEGVEPLLLFRTLATSARIFPRFMRAGVLDRGPVAIRDRELVILRTTARCRCEYEWGVHVAAFARPLGFSDAEIAATAAGSPDDALWSPRQAALLRLCDALHESARVPDALWQELRSHFEPDVLIELLYTVGQYHAVSFLANGLDLAPEPAGERFPTARA